MPYVHGFLPCRRRDPGEYKTELERCTAASPIAIASRSVERTLKATRVAAITGSTIRAAISRRPTIRIESATVSAASAATTMLSAPVGTPATRAPSSSRTVAASPVEQGDRGQAGAAERGDEHEVVAGDGEDRAEEESTQVDVDAPATEASTTPAAIPV
jgi:hypothetical protein